jgi:hypothetical protein
MCRREGVSLQQGMNFARCSTFADFAFITMGKLLECQEPSGKNFILVAISLLADKS